MGGWAAGLPILAPEETAASPSGLRCEALAGLLCAGPPAVGAPWPQRTAATALPQKLSNFQSDLIGLRSLSISLRRASRRGAMG